MSNNIRNTEVLVRLGNRVKLLRSEKGYSQEELGYAAEVEQSQIHRIENAKTNVTLSTLSALANAFGISLSELLTGV